jgi:hypothetical protein
VEPARNSRPARTEGILYKKPSTTTASPRQATTAAATAPVNVAAKGILEVASSDP